MEGVEKCGYLEVKEPSCIKGRKLKAWRRKWVVLQRMSNLASGTLAAKLELFPNEASSQINSPPTDKQVYLLENVTAVEPCHSKTHKLAFQIVQVTPILVLCSDSQEETNLWVSAFKQIFLPNQLKEDGAFKVTVVANENAKRCNLSGEYLMVVTPEVISIEGSSCQKGMEWRLDSLKRFYMDKNRENTLFIESGAKATCGEAKFEFQTTLVHEILQAIKTNINKAIELRKKRAFSSQEPRDRTMSMERGFQNLLSNSDQRSRTSSMASNISTTHSVSNSPTLSLKSALEKTAIWQDKNENYARIRCNSLNMDNNSSLEGSKESLCAHTRSHSLDAKSIKKSGFPHQYDILTLTEKSKPDEVPEIVGKVCVITEDSSKPVEIMLDSHGYSHIPGKFKSISSGNSSELKESENVEAIQNLNDECISKIETKELSSKSDIYLPVDCQDEKRSLSVGSHDSGVSCPSSYQQSTTEERTHRNKESFDSAISNSEISVSISEAIVVTDSNNSGFTRSFSHPHSMYLNEPKQERSNSEPTKTIASDTCEYANVESEYEDLDKYRKDLKKFLGMGDKRPEEVPPSLPERPSSLPPSRRVIKDSKRKRVSFTGFVQNRLSSSSDSDDAEHEVAALGSWPIRQIMGSNSLYAKVERNATAVVETKSDYDQNLYETIPAVVEEKESPISSMKKWPLQRNAQANCNRFYESNETLSKQLPSPDDADSSTLTETQPKQDQETSEDFLTGDAPYISTKVVPILSPSKQAPVVDLLSADIPEQQTKKLAVLDVLLPFNIDDIKQWENQRTKGQVASDERVDVKNPFPNIARYSGALESLSVNSESRLIDKSEIPKGCDVVTPGNIEDKDISPCVQREEDLINFDEAETFSNEQTLNLEDTYIPMEHKEPVYVEPSELQSKDE